VITDDMLMVRQRRQHEQRPVDLELLRWLSRFRFVSAELVEARFGVSARKCRKRLGRLEAAGLALAHQPHLAAPKLYAIGPKGRTLLGLEQRRPPRWDVQVVHELAIVGLVTEFETSRPGLRVLSERDCRRAEAQRAGRFSVTCQDRRLGLVRRWPDVVVEDAGRRMAVEIELAPKPSARLRTILLGYIAAQTYGEVQFLCGSPALERRVSGLVDGLGGGGMIRVGHITLS